MGCEHSDVMPFINAITQDQDQSHQNRPRPTQQQQTYGQPQYNQHNQYPQSQQIYQQPIPQQNYQQTTQPLGQVKVGGGRRAKPRGQREILQFYVNKNEDFLTHHLKYQLSLSRLTNMKRIKRRQLLEHTYLKCFWSKNQQLIKGLENIQGPYRESVVSAWIQRTFLDIWEQAHNDLFVKHLEEKEVRRKVSEQYMFELYQLKEYVDSGLATMSWVIQFSQLELYTLVNASDEALFNIFKKLKDRYPQTGGASQQMKFPDVPSTKTNMDLLNNFNKLSFSDPANMNYQTIYEDINFLLKRAIEEKDTFKSDMQQILGSDVLACPKVNQVTNQDGKKSFNACAVRRVFVKWAQNLLEKCPDLIQTKTFMKFIKSRCDIVNNFIFKSTVTSSTHKIVIDCVSLLLQVAKYNLDDHKKRDQFIFNIYDLLRCKIKKNTPNEIVDLLKKMQSTSMTKSGKKFEVIRVKNRFKTNNRDLLINFRYGDILIGQAQLCIDTAGVAKQTKLNYEFCHYIYELQRSLFGPTLELMMQYQDFQRPDITVSFEAEDLVLPRGNQKIKNSAPTNRKCMQGHDMITISGNFYFSKAVGETEEQSINKDYPCSCNYCNRSCSVQQPYDYCYHCGCFLCTACREQYKQADSKKFLLSIQRQDNVPAVNNLNQVKNLCNQNKSIIILFWLEDSSASTMYKDAIIYNQCKLQMQPGNYVPKIYHAKYNNSPAFKDLCNKYLVTQFPTIVLLNQQAEPVRTLIGFTWFQTPVIYLTQKRLLEGQSIQMQMKCNECNDGTLMTPMQKTQQKICYFCFNSNKPINMPEGIQNVGAFCQKGHYSCICCCYSALDCPSTYKEFLGQTYLSSNFINPKLPKCPKGHQTTISRANPVQSWTFKCFKCNKEKCFDNQHGTGECGQCKSYVCSQCLGAKILSYTQLKDKADMVDHYVQSTAEQACTCLCERKFKKTYAGRFYTFQEILNTPSENRGNWNCYICKKVGKGGELHMACFRCPKFEQIQGKPINVQICLNCANITKLLLRQVKQKAIEQPTVFQCPKDKKPLLLTSCKYNQKLTVDCSMCNKKYFTFTERLYCKSCNLNCCKDCRGKIVQKGLVPKCSHRCKNGHQLKFKFIDQKVLQLCDGCLEIVRQDGFRCELDHYTLCINCVSTKPPHFIGKGMQGFQTNQSDYQDVEQLYKNQKNDFNSVFHGYQNQQSEDGWW